MTLAACPHCYGRVGGPHARECYPKRLRAEISNLKRRAKLATRYLKSVRSGQFVTGSLVVAAIRTLSGEPLPLKPLWSAKKKRGVTASSAPRR